MASTPSALIADLLLDTDVILGEHGRTVALIGDDGGRYPYGNSMLVCGTDAGVLIDPSLSVATRPGVPGRVDRLLISHAHEDHVECSALSGQPVTRLRVIDTARMLPTGSDT